MPAWNIHDFGLGNIECHYQCAPSNRATTEPIRRFCRWRRRRTPRCNNLWVPVWLDKRRRLMHGELWVTRLMPDLRYEDPASYFNYLPPPSNLISWGYNKLYRSCNTHIHRPIFTNKIYLTQFYWQVYTYLDIWGSLPWWTLLLWKWSPSPIELCTEARKSTSG